MVTAMRCFLFSSFPTIYRAPSRPRYDTATRLPRQPYNRKSLHREYSGSPGNLPCAPRSPVLGESPPPPPPTKKKKKEKRNRRKEGKKKKERRKKTKNTIKQTFFFSLALLPGRLQDAVVWYLPQALPEKEELWKTGIAGFLIHVFSRGCASEGSTRVFHAIQCDDASILPWPMGGVAPAVE